MAIKINGTTVIDDSRNLSNIAGGLKTINSTSILGSGNIEAGAPKYENATLTQLGSTISIAGISSYTFNNFASTNSLTASSSYDFLLFEAVHSVSGGNGACYFRPDYQNATYSSGLYTASANSFNHSAGASITTTWLIYRNIALSDTSLNATIVADNPWKYHTHSISTGATLLTFDEMDHAGQIFTNPFPLSFNVYSPYSNNWASGSTLKIYGGTL